MALPLKAGAVVPLGVWVAAVLVMPVAAQTQSPVVIPPAPTIVASPAGSYGPAPNMPDTTETAPLTAVPPGLTQTPVPQTPETQAPETPGAAANTDTGAAVGAIPAPADSWAPATAARLGVLNVVDGSVSEVLIPVGGQASIGDLKVSVLACLRRPPGQVPDDATFINVQADAAGAPPPIQAADAPLNAPPESTADQENGDQDDPASVGGAQSPAVASGPPAYRGWMVRSMPAAMVVGDASETFRVIDCS